MHVFLAGINLTVLHSYFTRSFQKPKSLQKTKLQNQKRLVSCDFIEISWIINREWPNGQGMDAE